jgi:hypothetical protein
MSRRPSRLVLFVPLAACLAVGWSLSLPAKDGPPARQAAAPKQVEVRLEQFPAAAQSITITKAKKTDVETLLARLKNQYKFESIRKRLEYERGAERVAPKLTKETEKRLHEVELLDAMQGNPRRRSLEALHSAKAREFVRRSGFGLTRMLPKESPMYLPPPKPPEYRLATLPELSTGDEAGEVVRLPGEDRQGLLRLPSQTRLESLHFGSRAAFANPSTFGFVRDRDRVAGFTSHKFLSAPVLPKQEKQPENSEAWRIRRLELVSLLKHTKPRVYLSEALPRMEDLDDAKTRPLSAVEARHLDELRQGHDVAVEATPNVIRMLGSLRASKQCMECHSVQRGALLGAFTYELQRDPPLKAKDIPLSPAI